jgi:predicted nucleic-acid-binding Zn-ribbon protein
MLFCSQCESTEFKQKTSVITGGPNLNHVTVWILFECIQCTYFKLVRREKILPL